MPLTPFHVNWLVHRIHARHVTAAVEAHAGGRLLDVGCGARPFAGLLDRHSERSFGVDPDRQRYGPSAGGGPRRLPEAWASGLDLPFRDACFDTVLCLQVLEHVPRPRRLLDEIARVLRPGGALVLTAPHIWGLHEEPRDYYRFTPFGLRHLGEAAGLRVVAVNALAGYWVTAGARFVHYLRRLERVRLYPLTRPLMALVQLACLVLDRVHRVESDAWNHLLVARKPAPAPCGGS